MRFGFLGVVSAFMSGAKLMSNPNAAAQSQTAGSVPTAHRSLCPASCVFADTRLSDADTLLIKELYHVPVGVW